VTSLLGTGKPLTFFYSVPSLSSVCPTCLHLLFIPQNTYIYTVEYRAVSGVFRTIDPPTPSQPSECVLPPHQRLRGKHSPGGDGVGGSIVRKTPDIGLGSYNIIPLRFILSVSAFCQLVQRKSTVCLSFLLVYKSCLLCLFTWSVSMRHHNDEKD
jgi:hypothetical protein